MEASSSSNPAADDAPQGGAPAAPSTGGKIFLGGLSWETNEDKLKDHFIKYGEIQEVIVMRDRVTGKPRGFGFITFDSEEAASKACEDTHTLDGRTIDAKPSVPQDSQQRPRSKKIFVGGLAPETTPEQFKAYFERYGKVLEAQIMVDHTSNRSRGFGFVTFEEEGSVHSVFAAGPMHELAGKRVEVKSATPKGSGPQGRGAPLLPGGRPVGALGALGAAGGGGVVAGRPMEAPPAFFPGMGGYMGPGYGYMPGYGGFMPYHPAAFPGMVMGGFGYGPGYGPGGYAAPGPAMYGPMRPYPQPQVPPAAGQPAGSQPQQQQQQQQQQQPGAAPAAQQQRGAGQSPLQQRGGSGGSGRGGGGGGAPPADAPSTSGGGSATSGGPSKAGKQQRQQPPYGPPQLPREQSLPGGVVLAPGPAAGRWPGGDEPADRQQPSDQR